ncbi:MAG: class I SAM-dependent methyltransferase [Gammaproteobacteria bacterium]|nr:class I SAM-dependent methyltransferase [Gammaproteobacteria bacterium]
MTLTMSATAENEESLSDTSTTEKAIRVNTALRFYHEILGLENLHYGLWNNDPFTKEGLHTAQERYTEHLISCFPKSVQTVLDVGAGTGATSKKLKNQGYEVEAISPDPYQQYLFKKNSNVKFHLNTFQDFKPGHTFDLILMSESCQYIPMDGLFSNAKTCAAGGYLLINDYFITDPDNTAMSNSGHPMETFYQKARDYGFELLKEEDITDQAAVSLDLARSWMNRYVLPSLNLVVDSLDKKHPRLVKFLSWLLRKKIQKFNNDLMLLDSEHFKRVKRYKILLFKVPE